MGDIEACCVPEMASVEEGFRSDLDSICISNSSNISDVMGAETGIWKEELYGALSSIGRAHPSIMYWHLLCASIHHFSSLNGLSSNPYPT